MIADHNDINAISVSFAQLRKKVVMRLLDVRDTKLPPSQRAQIIFRINMRMDAWLSDIQKGVELENVIVKMSMEDFRDMEMDDVRKEAISLVQSHIRSDQDIYFSD